MNNLSRRGFLKILGVNIAVSLLPVSFIPNPLEDWPVISTLQMPTVVRRILQKVPNAKIESSGYLCVKIGNYCKKVSLEETQWSQERNRSIDKLIPGVPWAIVFHWYGDHELFDKTIQGYLRGFNQNKEENGRSTKTSAHFLIGSKKPFALEADQAYIDIVQLQRPSPEGIPYLAGSLRFNLPTENFNKRTYFLRAAERLKYQDENFHSILIDLFYDGRLDPNFRTIAVEVTGKDFGLADHYPSSQKMANIVSVTQAIMTRYQIPACNLVGHHEIDKNKSDPGNKFMAMIRFLIGIQGLISANTGMRELTFGRYIAGGIPPQQAILKYFLHIHEYLVLVSRPANVYEWEVWSKFWFIMDLIRGRENCDYSENQFVLPFCEDVIEQGYDFWERPGYGGVDICPRNSGETPVILAGNGKCLYVEQSPRYPLGSMCVFLHRLTNGAEIVSIYENLVEIEDINIGKVYDQGKRIGYVAQNNGMGHLRFSMAYASTWLTWNRQKALSRIENNDNKVSDYFIDPDTFVSFTRYSKTKTEKKLIGNIGMEDPGRW